VIERLRAVFDTNVFISASLSRNRSSPTRELLLRWRRGEFILVVCASQLEELFEKLTEFDVSQDTIRKITASIERIAEHIELDPKPMPALIPADPDDDIIIACAVRAQVDYLVTYDLHFDVLGGEYQGVKIVKALPFLWAVRGDRPPEQPPHRRSEA
jgi:putative PIN family toxin of toxin-antitoxin system